MPVHPNSLLDNVNRYFDAAAAFTAHPPGLLNQIKLANSVYRFKFPVRKPDGTIDVVRVVAKRAKLVNRCQRKFLGSPGWRGRNAVKIPNNSRKGVIL